MIQLDSGKKDLQVALRVLKGARRILAKKERWTQGWFAKTKTGRHVFFAAKTAICFCALGAVEKAARDKELHPNPARCALDKVLAGRTNGSMVGVAAWNDSTDRKHRDVLSLFDQTIKTVEASL